MLIKFCVQDHAPKHDYTRADVCRMLNLSERQLRSWERTGLVSTEESFSFSDLIALRTLQKLKQKRIPPKQIGRALDSLKRKLGGIDHPLSELRIACDGRAITVQIAGDTMEAISGQFLFNFDTAELGAMATMPVRQNAMPHSREADHWFQRGLDLEETGAPIDQAIAAYQKALELNPAAAGALVNIGTIEYRRGRFKEAERYYKQAVEADPKYALARFNLGNLYDELGDTASAFEQYHAALRLDPAYADAHFNLALLCERDGDPLKSVMHWKSYLRLDRTSNWADIARRQLERLKNAAIVRR